MSAKLNSKALPLNRFIARHLDYLAWMPFPETMRSFDTACLSSIKDLQPLEIKALREKLNVSQPVFARYLNTSVSTVQKWKAAPSVPAGCH